MSTIINADTSDGLKFTSDTSGEIKLQSGGADIATVNSSGITLATGKDLTLSSTALDASASGIYLGGTSAANLLDDYEEGTWTPYYTAVGGGSATYTKQAGTYVKNGDLVAASCHIIVTTHTFSGTIEVRGMPFTSKNNSLFTVSPIHIEGVNIATNVFAWAYIIPNSTQGNIRYYQNNTGSGFFNSSQMNSGADIMMNFIYRAE